MSRNDLRDLVQNLELSWSGLVDGRILPRIERAAVHVFTAPARSELPVRALDRGVQGGRNLLVVPMLYLRFGTNPEPEMEFMPEPVMAS